VSAPTYDESEWPLLVVTMPDNINDEELDTHHAELAAYIARGQLFAVVVDSRDMPALGPEGRKRSADFIRSQSSLAKEYVAAVALVHRNGMQTKILTAILWLVKPPVLLRVFTEPEEARDWAKEKLVSRRA
jgi:hypothetical protein